MAQFLMSRVVHFFVDIRTVASSIYDYLLAQNRLNLKEELLIRENQFREEKAFLMFSCDLSGIQSLIYTIASKGALKALRARSFYLEILLEHIVDTLLKACSLSRANLIYTGGGHAYILLPNTEVVLAKCRDILDSFNRWFMKNMGTRLFVAYAFQECSGNDLMNIPREKNPYQDIFSNLSRKLGEHKLRRYGADDIRYLNDTLADKRRYYDFIRAIMMGEGAYKCRFCMFLSRSRNLGVY